MRLDISEPAVIGQREGSPSSKQQCLFTEDNILFSILQTADITRWFPEFIVCAWIFLEETMKNGLGLHGSTDLGLIFMLGFIEDI